MAKRKGQTLVEVVVATVVAAMTATAVFSVVLSASVSGVKSDKREIATMTVKGVQDQLKSCVSVLPTDGTFSNGGNVSGVTPLGWALSAGLHTVDLGGGPWTGGDSLTYLVTDVDCGMGTTTETSCKHVQFTFIYQE